MRRNFGLLVLMLAVASSCDDSPPPRSRDLEVDWASRVQTFNVDVEPARVDTTFHVRDHFIASVEMQLSGEPLATTMGRALPDFSRDHLPTDLYFDPAIQGKVRHGGRVDLVGFSSAVESYEYSKQSLNNVALESGAGISELFGPVIDPDDVSGKGALPQMRALVQLLGRESNLAQKPLVLAGKWGADPTRWWTEVGPTNPFGWRGIWPIMLPFSSFDPHIAPTSSVSEHCSISSDDDPGKAGAIQSNDYECDYTQLHLPDRDKQVSGTVDPGSSGWHSWKAALWVLNYLQLMHDSAENPIERVPEAQLAGVGAPGNKVAGAPSAGHSAVPGVYLGSSNIEGFQAAMFVEMIDNQVEEWLKHLTTTDGASLSGFSTLMEATSYTTTSPLRWFPGRLRVTESPDESGFPRPTSFSIVSSDSELLDLAGMLGGYSSLYALTDHDNRTAGGSQPARAYFDGDPFVDDDQIANGQATTHDRMLAMMRVLVVNIERMHRDPASGLLVDVVHMTDGKIARETTLSSDTAAYALLALRTARRALGSELALYSNTTPDTRGIPTVLDSLPPIVTASAGQSLPFGRELDNLIMSLSGALYDDLTTPDGTAFSGWNIATHSPTDGGLSLDAHSAAIRGLLVAYLATGDVRYRERALVVYERLESAFYFSPARVYRATAGAPPEEVTFTPRRFGLLQGALRDIYELIAVSPGHEPLASQVKDRIARLNKLVLNGWDDRDQDEQVEWPDECVRYVKDYAGAGSRGPEGHVLVMGGLEMAERSLTGETGSLADVPSLAPRRVTTDREHDCVPEISAVGLPAALASSVTFRLTPSPDAWASRTRAVLAEEERSAAAARDRRSVPSVVGSGAKTAGTIPAATHSGPLVLSPDGTRLYVVHPDADVVTSIDTRSGQVVQTFPLTQSPPSVDPTTGHYWPAAAPLALALDPGGGTLFVTGERSGHVYAFDTRSGAKVAERAVCAEPTGVLVDARGKGLFVACSNDDRVVELSPDTLVEVASAACPRKPWALAWGENGELFSTHLLTLSSELHDVGLSSKGAGVSVFATAPLAYQSTWTLADGPPGVLPTTPHGEVRALYDAVVRPGTNELWVVHTMLGTDTPQPALDFQTTVFPAVSILDGRGAALARLTVSSKPGDGAAFGDIVSGPRALTFSPDGRFAFLVDTASEDVLIVNAEQRVEAALVRPLPGHQPEGAVWGLNGKLYVQERNSLDVAILDVVEGASGITATVETSTWKTLAVDPMPPQLRLGQHLFFSANSDEYPLTSNHWVSCNACHIEGRSGAVTWRFLEGPRDTPTNAGGLLDTGLLFRTGDRRRVEDYWKTIDEEEGGHFRAAEPTQAPLLEALAGFVNHAIFTPSPPTLDIADRERAAQGRSLFESAGCSSCHSGSALTDSGLRSAGTSGEMAAVLHDVGTCVTSGPARDMPHEALDGQPRGPCAFDTPQLRGLVDSAPYLHDGSAPTLAAAVGAMLKGTHRALSMSDQEAIVTYLRRL